MNAPERFSYSNKDKLKATKEVLYWYRINNKISVVKLFKEFGIEVMKLY